MVKWFIRLQELLADWSHLVKRDGWGSALPAAAREIQRLPYYHAQFTIVGRDLSEPIPEPQPKIPLEFRSIEAKDMDLIGQIHRPSEARSGAQRLERGHRGLIAFHEGQPVGYAWGCHEVNPALERVSLDLSTGDMLCVDAYTAPSFRRNGVQTALTLARFQLFRDLGYQRALAYIEKGNLPSLAVWRKVGAETVGHLDFRRILVWRKSHQHWLAAETDYEEEQ